jgi:hypothetical protein
MRQTVFSERHEVRQKKSFYTSDNAGAETVETTKLSHDH